MVLKRELWTSGAIFFFTTEKINMNDTECKTLAEELVDNITNILKWEAREEVRNNLKISCFPSKANALATLRGQIFLKPAS